MKPLPISPEAASDAEPEVNQPGLSELREAVANRLRKRLPSRARLGQDGLAGLNSALSSVPDGMASGVLAGVNPVYGLYACMVGPIAGSLFSSTQLMVIVTTSASALGAGQALAGLTSEARENALFLLVVLIGAFQILFGLLRLGQLTRFVSYSVMTGFIIGIAVLTVLSQLPTVTGYQAEGNNKVSQTLDLLTHLNQIHLLTLGVSALTLLLAVTLPRTRLGNFGRLVAIIVPSALVALLGLESVQIVQDVGNIPRGFPLPRMPSFSAMSPEVVTGALAVAAVILVQGTGVSQSVPNPDGARRSTSRDFIAQGAANLASGFCRGLPVGGSLSTTALTVLSGAGSRWAAIFAGLWMAAIVMLFPGLVSYTAMPALAALLIVASAYTIKPSEVRAIWQIGWPSRLASVTTFLCTLFLPIQVAVGIGVVLSALINLNESSTDVSLVELVEWPDGRIEERPPPKALPAHRVTALDVYGHLFYAGARTLERLLPRPEGAQNPVVILRLRGRSTVGATLVEVLARYADKLEAVDGRLYLTGISEQAYDQMRRTGKLRLTGPVRAYEATLFVGEATRQALADARAWLVGRSVDASPGEAPPDGTSAEVIAPESEPR
jgi:SulP family sulfate permease